MRGTSRRDENCPWAIGTFLRGRPQDCGWNTASRGRGIIASYDQESQPPRPLPRNGSYLGSEPRAVGIKASIPRKWVESYSWSLTSPVSGSTTKQPKTQQPTTSAGGSHLCPHHVRPCTTWPQDLAADIMHGGCRAWRPNCSPTPADASHEISWHPSTSCKETVYGITHGGVASCHP